MIRPRWPLPIGATRSMMRAVRSSLEPLPRSSLSRLVGWSGVRFSNRTLCSRAFRRVEVDLADLEQREVALAVLRRTDQAGDRVAGAQVEAADLARADVDVVRPGEIGAVGGAQEAEAVLQDLQHAVAVDVLAAARMRLEDREDDVLLARTGQAFQPHLLRDLDQFGDRLELELRQVHRLTRCCELGWGNDSYVVGVEIVGWQLVVHLPVIAAAIAVAVVAAVAGDRRHRRLFRPDGYGPDYLNSLSQFAVQKCDQV